MVRQKYVAIGKHVRCSINNLVYPVNATRQTRGFYERWMGSRMYCTEGWHCRATWVGLGLILSTHITHIVRSTIYVYWFFLRLPGFGKCGVFKFSRQDDRNKQSTDNYIPIPKQSMVLVTWLTYKFWHLIISFVLEKQGVNLNITRALEPGTRGRMLPIAIYLHKPAIAIVFIEHCDVILIVTSFATELDTPTVTDVRTLRTPYRV